MSSPLSDAWNQWMKDHADTLDATTLNAPVKASYYLENRLNRAYMDGALAGRQIARDEVADKLKDLLLQ